MPGLRRLYLARPVSVGILLSYRCPCACRHCLYASSPRWRAEWISIRDLYDVLSQLSRSIRPASLGVGLNEGLHFTGGEPVLNFNLLYAAVDLAQTMRIPSRFVETNAFWCTGNDPTSTRFTQLRDAGLDGVLVSVNPYLLEYVPFERTQRAVTLGGRVFGRHLMVYQRYFYDLFQRHSVTGTLPFDASRAVYRRSLGAAELLPMGRACYQLAHLYRAFPAARFFDASCHDELTRNWHVHVDPDCNYIPGFCGGISLGDARTLDALCADGIDLTDRPILDALVEDVGRLYQFAAAEFDYRPLPTGYISKCHLCLDIRRCIAQRTDAYAELQPREFYSRL